MATTEAEAPGRPTRPATRARRLWAWAVVPALLAAAVLAQTRAFRLATCETYDEFTYLRMGICVFRQDDVASLSSPMCPPLPILLEYWWPSLAAKALPDTPGWEEQVPELTRQARILTAVTLGVPLVLGVYAWLARRRGWAAGAFGAGLVAFSPTVLAAASVAATDACFGAFGLLALAVIHAYERRPSRWTFAAAGVAIGLAVAAKQTGVILVGVVLAGWLRRIPARPDGWTWVDYGLWILARFGLGLAALGGLAFLTDWACYGFRFAPRFDDAGTHLPFPVFVTMLAEYLPNGKAFEDWVRHRGPPIALDTFLGQIDHARKGHAAFLMGERSAAGWWYYFPVAMVIKSTPSELAAFGLVLAAACRAASWRDPTRRLWLTALGLLLAAGVSSRLNIGQRYMLLAYPLAAMLAADVLADWAGRRRLPAVGLGAVLLVGQVVTAVGIAPHYLSYFNGLCGGPMEGYRYLVDSNLDWGQDLPSLRRELEARGYHKVALAYFGTAKPGTYGLRAVDWMGPIHPTELGCDWLAISATSLQGPYGGQVMLQDAFRDVPSARAGYSIFLYDFRDPKVRAAYDRVRALYEPRTPAER